MVHVSEERDVGQTSASLVIIQITVSGGRPEPAPNPDRLEPPDLYHPDVASRSRATADTSLRI